MADTHEARKLYIYWCPKCERQTERQWHIARRGHALIPQNDVEHECERIEVVRAAENAALREKVEAVEAIAALGGWESSYSLFDAYRRLAEHRREEFARMGKDEDARECERLRDVLDAALAAVSASSTTEPCPTCDGAGCPECSDRFGPRWPDDEMCPNCVTPWKCNGPHKPASSSAPTEGGET